MEKFGTVLDDNLLGRKKTVSRFIFFFFFSGKIYLEMLEYEKFLICKNYCGKIRERKNIWVIIKFDRNIEISQWLL